jgi:ABC-type glutathione transport system ATPase component
MAESLLSVRGVSNTYVSRAWGIVGKRIVKPVLDNINIEIAPGEIFGLVGESGCGKTTLGRCILGLTGYEGEIFIDGVKQDSRGRTVSRREMACRLQAVFQDPAASLNPVKHAGWLLEEPLRVHRLGSKQERLKRVDEILDLVGLDSSYKDRRVNELSVGQKQRICIGCALMLKPKLIIADEAQNTAPQSGFAAPRFTHQAEDFPRRDFNIDVVQHGFGDSFAHNTPCAAHIGV